VEEEKTRLKRKQVERFPGKKYLVEDFDAFISNHNCSIFNKDLVEKFFYFFLDFDISHQQTNETYALYTRKLISFEFSKLNELNNRIFFF
jgi:hypothetical protein